MKLKNVDYDALPELISRKEFCLLIGIGRHLFWRWTRERGIRVVRFGRRGHPRIPKQLLLHWVDLVDDKGAKIGPNRSESAESKPAPLTDGRWRVIRPVR
jgi:hypothetical protein